MRGTCHALTHCMTHALCTLHQRKAARQGLYTGSTEALDAAWRQITPSTKEQLKAVNKKLTDLHAEASNMGGKSTSLELFLSCKPQVDDDDLELEQNPRKEVYENLLAGKQYSVPGSNNAQYFVSLQPDSAHIRTPTCTCPSFTSGNNFVTKKVHKRGSRDPTQLGKSFGALPAHLRMCKHLKCVLAPSGLQGKGVKLKAE